MTQEVILIMGMMASGKTSLSQDYLKKGYVHLNRDTIGGKVRDLVPLMEAALLEGKSVVLDNTHGTRNSRRPFIEAARKLKTPIHCLHRDISIEDAQFNAAKRLLDRRGKLLSAEELKADKDPNIFPVYVLFSYQKMLEKPSLSEGFSSVETIPFIRNIDPSYTKKALILDYDGTLRETLSGDEYPKTPADIQILPGRAEKLRQYQDQGYLLLGVSNQSGIEKGSVSNGAVRACFDKTNELLGHQIDYVYCPHASFPIGCYCRKPMSGWGVYFIEKYQLNASECIFVGDKKTDETFAYRSGFQFSYAKEFFQ